MSDTIYALASGGGRAGVAVIRISGPRADTVLSSLTGKALPAARLATRVLLKEPGTGEALDDGLALRFPAPRSYTGEDVVELQVHGGLGVIAAVLEALGRLEGLRLAEPGEFTRRAVLAGKLDLTAAEGLLDLIEADTDAQRRQALRQTGGALGRLYDGWRARLVGALAHLEAAIDFPDEELPEDLAAKFRGDVRKLADEMARHLDDGRRGERLRRGATRLSFRRARARRGMLSKSGSIWAGCRSWRRTRRGCARWRTRSRRKACAGRGNGRGRRI